MMLTANDVTSIAKRVLRHEYISADEDRALRVAVFLECRDGEGSIEKVARAWLARSHG